MKLFLTSILLCSLPALQAKTKLETPAIPLLAGTNENAVFSLPLEGTVHLKSVKVELSKDTLKSDIESIGVYYSSSPLPNYGRMKLYGQIKDLNSLEISNKLTLKDKKNYLWLRLHLKKDVNIEHTFEAKISEVNFQDKSTLKVNIPSRIQRLAVSVRDTGDDNARGYRIPGITTTKKGTLLSVYDIRYNSARDLQGHMDIGLSRSTDGGKTWGKMMSIIDMGTWGGLPEKFNGVSDACILVDEKTGHIYVAGLWMHGVNSKDKKWIEGLNNKSKAWAHQWNAHGSLPGLTPRETCQFMMVKSEDDGLTWSKPMNLTKMLKKPKWHLFAPAPGRGITMTDGTLVMPTQGRDEESRTFSNFIYSKDNGKTWKCSNFAKTNTTECQIAELSDGSLMLNMRDNRNRSSKDFPESGRSVAVTKDLGVTWTEHPTSRVALPEPVCCAGLLRHTFKKERPGLPKSILIFSNPPTKTKKGGRKKITVKVSLDDGNTWPSKYHLELDTFKGAYSCLTSVDDDHIGILYEGSRARICFQKIKIADLLEVRAGKTVSVIKTK